MSRKFDHFGLKVAANEELFQASAHTHSRRKQLVTHLCTNHNRKRANGKRGDGDVEFPCVDCDLSGGPATKFASQALYRSHLLETHLTKGDTLQGGNSIAKKLPENPLDKRL